MSRTTQQPAADFVWSEDDWERAGHALNRVFEDQDWSAGEVRLKQNTLIEDLRQVGIGRALARSLIDRLLARKVFRTGKSFVDLQIFVRFDGRQTDTVTPNRWLIISRQRWAAYRTKQRSAGRPRVRRQTAKRVTATALRDKQLEARDKWIYRQCCRTEVIYKDIKSSLQKLCLQRGWRKVSSIQGLRAAAKNYAHRHDLPLPPRRQDL